MASAELFGRTKVGLMLLIMFWQTHRERERWLGLRVYCTFSLPPFLSNMV
jgi:hypothetical protein